MKKIHTFLTILLVSITITSFAQNTNTSEGIRFENLTFNKALEKAKQTNKIIFIDCYTTWCGPCKYMEKNIFSLKEAGEYFNTKFINLKIDMMQEEGKKISSKYPVKGYPTFLFIDGDGKEVARVMGSTNTFAEFKSKIEEVLNSDNSLESLKTTIVRIKTDITQKHI
jgi:Thiol:disulfide interchange protein